MRFGVEIEKDNVGIRTSAIEAQILFWKLVLEKKPKVISDLLNFTSEAKSAPLLSYLGYIFKGWDEIDRLIREIDDESIGSGNQLLYKQIRAKALKRILPDWKNLQLDSNADSLCLALKNWSNNFNLTDDWCLDFALDVLREFAVEVFEELELSRENPSSNINHNLVAYLEYVKKSNVAIERVLNSYTFSVHAQSLVFYENQTNYPEFKFNQKDIEIRQIWFFWMETAGEFKKKILRMLEEFYNRQSKQIPYGMKSRLNAELDNYISSVKKNFGKYIKKTRKNSGDTHFRWLTQFQIAPSKNYSEIAAEVGMDIKSVSEAINDIATLLGLTLRKSSSGRPKGSKDKKERFRASKN